MRYISCEDYYENYLGDWCNNKCEECFGDKEIYKCIETFEVCGKTLLDKVTIEKGEEYWIRYETNTHIGLYRGDDHILHIIKELFEKYFR